MIRNLAGLIIIVGSGIYLARRFYFWKRCYCSKNIENELIIITGCTSGIGLSLAWDLAKRGASLILACRDVEKGLRISQEITKSTKNSRIRVQHLDLASLANVSEFSKKIIDLNEPIYALVNNAGIFYANPSNTIDGVEVTFQTNYLSPFLLSLLILPALRKHKSNSRIINVSSRAHLIPTEIPNPEFHLTFEDTPLKRFEAYQYSKFCLTLSANHLNNILSQSNVKVFCVDPGNTETNIFRSFPQLSNSFLFAIQKPIRFFIIRTPHEGIQSIVHGLLANEPPFYIENLREGTINRRILFPTLSIPTEWNDDRRGLRKTLILFNYINMDKVSEMSECLVEINDVGHLFGRESEYLNDSKDQWIRIGSATTPIDCYIEILLQKMFSGETSRCFITTKMDDQIEFTMTLKDIKTNGYFFQLSTKDLYDVASKYKENGVKMYKKYPSFAQNYFNLSAKLLLSLKPFNKNTETEYEERQQEFDYELIQSLYDGICLNIAACLIKQDRYEEVLHVLKDLTEQSNNEKGIYRRSLAHLQLKQYNEAKEQIERLKFTENREFYALYNRIMCEMKEYNDNYVKMVKKMFG